MSRTLLLVIALLFSSLLIAQGTGSRLVPEGASAAPQATQAVAEAISYQGQLTDASGDPLTGSHDLVFRFYDQPTSGNQVGSSIARDDVAVDRGLFTVRLDAPAAHFTGQALWLEITVDGQLLLPRQEVLPVPYALGLRPGGWIVGQGQNPALGIRAQGLGNTTALSVTGLIGLDASGMTGVIGRGDTGVLGRGIVGIHGVGSPGYGVHGQSDTAAAVYGESRGGYGLHGTSQFADGVHGETSHGFQAGVSGAGPTGVFGSGSVVGVSGYAKPDGATGVMGTVEGDGAKAVVGRATGYSSIAVEGNATFGTGVSGSGEVGVKGSSSVGFGIVAEGPMGIQARGRAGDGLTAVSEGSADAAGVRGEGTLQAAGGWFASVQGHGVTAYSRGAWLNGAAIYAENPSANQGMAGVLKNSSGYHTAHIAAAAFSF